jgi:quinol monooxygenase YgiN
MLISRSEEAGSARDSTFLRFDSRSTHKTGNELTSDVSITARPFFERYGFTVEAEQHPVSCGVPLTNYTMTKKLLDRAVCLSGQLVCHTQDQENTVRDHLPLHLALTRAEPGCRSFIVTATSDPLVWQVEERFEHAAAFETHQERVASSEWGQDASDIERRYFVRGL